ncbi:PREDICTED: ADP-ribosyl cyclase/cyclic ADP-ribose hydrolase 1 [Chinchilla lanigera]|uniref:ADP-ribosyl cyclase/cyclic ADP-ribose hydrolase 1 n=1 Tax=Chinchilla lanigera TaxID=34839 RepID=A0A8C2UPW9_CHILA|nr:PREDICTED: ADP-ribosyl cyclase/cyclic ADP-ribose hydrolase 1 [Chinchilla lanigera]
MANYEFSPMPRDERCCRLSRRSRVCLCLGLLVLVACAVVLAAALTWSRAQTPEPLAWNGAGTTRNLLELVLGRCYSYTQLVRLDLRSKDCPKILDAFKNAFISKNPCNITKEDYEPLLDLVNQTVPCNKSLFWSKSKDLAHQYTRVQGEMFTLEDTLLGYLADDLTWCGDPGSAELNHQSCPHWNECLSNPGSVFWKVISQKFAESACGVVQVMLNGSLSEPFRKSSTFGSVEVFNLDPRKVHTLQAWVMHDIGGISSDSCSSASINELKSIVTERNMTFTCQNNYRPVRFIQCVKNPEHPSCTSEI